MRRPVTSRQGSSTPRTGAGIAPREAADDAPAEKAAEEAAAADLREHPELYRVGRGEQGVFRVQPYKDELLPHWRFCDARPGTHEQ